MSLLSAIALTQDRKIALFSRLLTAPLRPGDFILSYSLPYVLMAIFQAIVFFAIGALLGLEIQGSIGLLLLVLFLIAIFCIGLGMILGSVFNENQVSGIGAIVVLFASLFGGFGLDLERVGGLFQIIGNALPFAHAVSAARDFMLDGAGIGDIALDLYWVLGYTVIIFTLSILCFRWRTKR